MVSSTVSQGNASFAENNIEDFFCCYIYAANKPFGRGAAGERSCLLDPSLPEIHPCIEAFGVIQAQRTNGPGCDVMLLFPRDQALYSVQ